MSERHSQRGGICAGTSLVPQIGRGEQTETRTFWPTPENPETITKREPVETTPVEADFQFRIGREPRTGDIVSILATSPDDGIRAPLVVGEDHVAHRSVVARDKRYQTVEWTRHLVADARFEDSGRLFVDLLHSPDPSRSIQRPIDSDDLGDEEYIERVSAARLCESLAAESSTSMWHYSQTPFLPLSKHGTEVQTEEAYLPPDSPYEPVPSCQDLNFVQISGDGAREDIVNPFLAGGPDGTVSHQLGTVQKWKAAFGAYHGDRLIGVVVLAHNPNADFFEKTNEVLITRLACHPTRPTNCASWMIARGRDWARKEGFEQIAAHAGVGDNRGTIYKAAGFDLDPEHTGWAPGDGWCNRDGRDGVRDGYLWYRRKWVDSLQ